MMDRDVTREFDNSFFFIMRKKKSFYWARTQMRLGPTNDETRLGIDPIVFIFFYYYYCYHAIFVYFCVLKALLKKIKFILFFFALN